MTPLRKREGGAGAARTGAAMRPLALCATILSAIALSAAVSPAAGAAVAAAVDPSLLAGLHWRLVGPFRGGRALTVTGVPGDPRTFYFGAAGGGIWNIENA